MAASKIQVLHYHGMVEIDMGGAYVSQDVSRPDRHVPYMRGGKAVRWRKYTQVEDSVPSLEEARHCGLGKPVRCGEAVALMKHCGAEAKPQIVVWRYAERYPFRDDWQRKALRGVSPMSKC